MSKPSDYPNTIVPALHDAIVCAQSYKDTQEPDYLHALANILEVATVQTRNHFERICAGREAGRYGGKPISSIPLAGMVELYESRWLHITLNALLPHCRFKTPQYLTDTLTRLLDGFQQTFGRLPYYEKALLVIDERSSIAARKVFDQDNKGWKAIPNALKGRIFPDDSQDSLDLALLSKGGEKPCCHIYIMAQEDAADFFALRIGGRI